MKKCNKEPHENFKVNPTPILQTRYGDLAPGCHLVYESNEYKLDFGWHINYSNQNIYSWYLIPVDCKLGFQTNTGYDSLSNGMKGYIRTLYKDMVPNIEAVRYMPDIEGQITIPELLDRLNRYVYGRYA